MQPGGARHSDDDIIMHCDVTVGIVAGHQPADCTDVRPVSCFVRCAAEVEKESCIVNQHYVRHFARVSAIPIRPSLDTHRFSEGVFTAPMGVEPEDRRLGQGTGQRFHVRRLSPLRNRMFLQLQKFHGLLMKRFMRLDRKNAFKVGGPRLRLSLICACFNKDFCSERVPHRKFVSSRNSKSYATHIVHNRNCKPWKVESVAL